MASEATGERGAFHYPGGIEDFDGIRRYAGDIAETNRYYRHEMERAALRNVLYYLGVQWIRYDPDLRIWRPQGLRRTTPRPVTNRLAELVNAAVSNIVSYRVPVTYGPATDDPADVAAAVVADRVHDVIEKEADIRHLKPLIARWIIMTGNVFLINHYDTSADSGTTFVQSERCVECGYISQPLEIEEAGGICPQCMKDTPAVWEPAIDNRAVPIGQEYPRGRFYTEAKPLFSCYFDNEVTRLQDSSYFMVSETRGKDWVERMYGEKLAGKSTALTRSDPYTHYVETLAYSTALGGRIWGMAPHRNVERARVRRLWLKPHPTYAPKGIYAVLVGDEIAEAKEWPYHDERGEPFLNVIHMGFDQVPGRFLYKTRVDDVAVKQEQRNRVEAIIELHSIRMANSVWLVPEGSGISRITGEQGQFIKYNALAGVPAPTRVPGDQVSPYLMNWLAFIDKEMQDIMGLTEVSRGEAPRGVSAYAALQLLDERAQTGQSNLLDNWSLGWMAWSKQMIDIWREYADEERLSALGEGQWAIQKFNKAQLRGGVDISVELGQIRPRTQVGRRAVADQAVRLGLINVFDPSERIHMLKLLGIPEIMEDYKIDESQASRENDMFLSMNPDDPTTFVPPPLPWENHPAHWMIHKRLILSEQFRLLPPPVQMAIVEHVNMHWQPMVASSQMSRGAGTVAPGKGGKENKGTAEGGGPSDTGATDEDQLDMESQLASPDTNVGAPAMGR